MYTVISAYNGTARDRNFFPLQAGCVFCTYLKYVSSGLQVLGSVKGVR